MKKFVFTIALFCYIPMRAQIPVEIFSGYERTTLDIMFFKYFKNKKDEPSPWLFFNRNRASVDYRMTGSEFTPQFGFTEAVSYNHPGLKGFAPVVLAQLLNRGVYPKAGVQYALIRKQLTLFSWLVTELKKDNNLDYFLLFRYTPAVAERWKLFLQFETLNVFPTKTVYPFSFVQRVRLGVSIQRWQFGAGADLSQAGRTDWTNTHNPGVFLRHEF